MKKTFQFLHGVIFLVLVLANAGFVYSQTKPLTGLHFSSHEVNKDQRTTLNLTPERSFSFTDGFSMEFDARFRPGDGHFGYIFRTIGNDTVNIDLVSNFWSSENTFSLVYKDTALFTYSWEDVPNGEFGSWIHIKLQIDKEANLTVSMNGNSKKKKLEELAALQNFHIEFGACKFSSFLTTDVSPMTVKNILVYDGENQVHRNWKLAKHLKNKVFDEVKHAVATAHNPMWEINKHLEWQKEQSLRVSNLIGIAKDEENGRVFLVNDQAVYVCKMKAFSIDTVESVSIDTLTFTKGKPFPCRSNQILYNPLTDELWSYSFTSDTVSRFDFKTRSWSLSDPECLTPDLWHHSSFLSPADSSFVTFGGYGFYTYKSLFNSYSQENEKWEQKNLIDHIHPRYMSGMGPWGKEKVLIFGGYGSISGRQEISPNFYYDLYSIDKNGSVPEKLWNLESVDSPFVPTQSLITETDSNSFYTLIYNPVNFRTSLTLAKFNIAKPEKTLYADSIPYKFLDTESWSTLFLNKKTSRLIALTTYENEVEMYSLAYPPLLAGDVYQEELTAYSKMEVWYSFLLPGLAALLAFLFIVSKRKAHNKSSKTRVLSKSEETGEGNPLPGPDGIIKGEKVSAIYLLGGFQVYDKNGLDITSHFTPTLKQLFLLIFLSSVRNGKGLSSSRLEEVLWFDKTEESARNNRNVNISKLRVLFKNIDHIVLEHNNTSWKVTFGNKLYSDYTEAMQLIGKSRSSAGLEEEETFRLIQIASSGELCPNIQADWMDKFKVDFANELINTLTVLSTNIPENTPNKNHLLCAISDCILNFDILNEEAIAIKCIALLKTGRSTVAKQSYDLFCREYKQLLGVDFSFSFNDLVKSK